MLKIKTKKTKKFLAGLGVLGMLFFQAAPIFQAQASTQDIIDWMLENGSGMAGVGTTNTYTGLGNSSSLVGSSYVAALSSEKGPSVAVSFSANEPFADGVKVTATAVPGGFLDKTNDLYFTWYIKHKGCELKNNVGGNNSCDLDGDEDITENDWKIAAARIIAKGDFVLEDANYSSTSGFDEDAAGVEANPSVENEWVINFKRNGNGDLEDSNDSSDDILNCYVQEPKTGFVYEIRETTPIFNSCPNGYHPACTKDTTAACDVLNPLFTNPSGSISKSISNNFNACAVDAEGDDKDDAEKVLDCDIKNAEDLRNFESYAECKNGGEPICVSENGSNSELKKDSDGTLLGIIFAKDKIGESSENDTNGVCSALAKPNESADPDFAAPPNFLDNTQPLIAASSEACSVVVDGLINGVTSSGSTVATGNDELDLLETGFNENESTCSFEKGNNLCKHLFPYFPKKKVVVNGEEIDLSNKMTGDGIFSMEEKEFWGTDPKNASTNGKQKDEASVMGLGVDQFSWLYSAGDEVGVVVEGTSTMTTEHADSSYRRMWAFSKGVCTELEDLGKESSVDNGERGFYVDNESNNGILTASFDLDMCLEENLIKPEAEQSGVSSMKIELSATPENPINDPEGSGDIVTVAASAQNTANLSNIYYDWKIEKSGDGANIPNDNTAWTDITTDMINKYKSLSQSDKQGVGKKELNFWLNLPENVADPSKEGVFYLRIRVTATEQSGSNSQTSKGAIVIKVREQGKRIATYYTSVSDSGMFGFVGGGSASGLMCNDLQGRNNCMVTKNQIIGLKVPNEDNDLSGFSWKVNNVPMACTSNMSSLCGSADSNILFVPILGNVGEVVNVVVTAISKKTGETIELSRRFIIVEPQMQITSGAGSGFWPRLLGYYKDLNGNKYPDYSTKVYETNPGNNVSISATALSSQGFSGQDFSWNVDGVLQDNSSETLSFVVDRPIGDSYNIGLVLNDLHTPEQDKQANNLRRALFDNWEVDPEEYIDNNVSANIEIVVVGTPQQASAELKQGGIFAGLAANLPENLMFLLKITLTSFLIIFSMGLIFAFVPESIFEKERKNTD